MKTALMVGFSGDRQDTGCRCALLTLGMIVRRLDRLVKVNESDTPDGLHAETWNSGHGREHSGEFTTLLELGRRWLGYR